jgi:hypothetical protein
MSAKLITARSVFLNLVAGAIACLALAGVGQAAPTTFRAFVSTAGSDSNPCSAVQPCRTFNQALAVVQPGGEIIAQTPGGYSGGFTITHSVTIDAGGFDAVVTSTTASALCTINAGPTDRVVLRGISFHGANVGQHAIDATQVGSLYIEHCTIAEFKLYGVFVENGGNLWVTDTTVRKCDMGVFAQVNGPTALNLIVQESQFSECSECGVMFQTVAGTGAGTGLISNCTATLCGGGFEADSEGPSNDALTLTNCRVSESASGVTAFSGIGNLTLSLVNCVITNNSGPGLFFDGQNFFPSLLGTSPGTNLVSGNGTNGSFTSTAVLN